MNNNLSDRKFLLYLSECTSTNDYMKELVQAKSMGEGAGVYTGHQTSGKGQYGRRWHDVPHMNLALSILLKPVHWSYQGQFMLNKLIVSAVHHALVDYATPLTIKWPNDIFYKDRKLAGILIENSWVGKQWEFSIVGVGVNVNGDAYPAFEPEPVSLRQLSRADREFDIGALAEAVAVNILNWYRNKEVSEVAGYYHEHLYARGVYRRFMANGKYFTSAINEVTEEGRLALFESNGDIAAYEHGKVKFCF